jgi:hypothetical protein
MGSSESKDPQDKLLEKFGYVQTGSKTYGVNDGPSWYHYFDIMETYKLIIGDETGVFLRPYKVVTNDDMPGFRREVVRKPIETYHEIKDFLVIGAQIGLIAFNLYNHFSGSSAQYEPTEQDLNRILTNHNNQVYASIQQGTPTNHQYGPVLFASATDLDHYPQPTDSREVLEKKIELNRQESYAEIISEIVNPHHDSDVSEFQSNEQVAREYIRQYHEPDNSNYDKSGSDTFHESNHSDDNRSR